MIDGAATFPPLWPGSTVTTLPSRIPVAVGENRPGPPGTVESTGGEAVLLPGAGLGGRRADDSAELLIVAGGAAVALWWSAGVGELDWPAACTTVGPMLQALRSIATAGNVQAIRCIRSPCLRCPAGGGVPSGSRCPGP